MVSPIDPDHINIEFLAEKNKARHQGFFNKIRIFFKSKFESGRLEMAVDELRSLIPGVDHPNLDTQREIYLKSLAIVSSLPNSQTALHVSRLIYSKLAEMYNDSNKPLSRLREQFNGWCERERGKEGLGASPGMHMQSLGTFLTTGIQLKYGQDYLFLRDLSKEPLSRKEVSDLLKEEAFLQFELDRSSYRYGTYAENFLRGRLEQVQEKMRAVEKNPKKV